MHMGLPDRLETAHAAVAALFGERVAVAVTDPRLSHPEPLAGEAEHLRFAIARRHAEFAAGRAVARRAMAALGHPEQPVMTAADRSPIWPRGLTGSISHSETLCVAAVSDGPVYLGLDIEPDAELSEALVGTICSRAEIARVRGPEMLRHASLIFSAKEAAYKAQFPITRKVFGFDHIDLTLNFEQRRFTATYLRPAHPFEVGDQLQGRFDIVAGHIVTAVSIPQVSHRGG